MEEERLTTEEARPAAIAAEAEEGAARGVVLVVFVLVAAEDGAGDGTRGFAPTAGAGSGPRPRVGPALLVLAG